MYIIIQVFLKYYSNFQLLTLNFPLPYNSLIQIFRKLVVLL